MYGVERALRLAIAIGVVLGACGGSTGSNHGSPDPAMSSLTVDRNVAVADGSDAIAITAHIVDAHAAPLAGCVVTFAATGSGNTIASAATTDIGGTAPSTLTSQVAEAKSITAEAACDGEPAVPIRMALGVQFVHGPATQLVFLVQPPDAAAGVALAPAVAVAIEDAAGNVASDVPGTVSVSLAANPGNIALAGTAQVALANGVATFADIDVGVPGQAYQLDASSTATSATTTSYPFNVTYGPPSSASSLTLMPASVPADGVTAIDAVVTIVNSGGVAIPGLPVTVTMGSGDVFPREGTTDVSGKFVTKLTSTVVGMPTVTATSGALTLTATASFQPAPCTLLFPGLPTLVQTAMAGIVAGDYDGDGHQDLAVLHTGDLAILRGVGDGRLHAPYSIATPSGNVALAGGDLDNDGKMDLVTANTTSIVVFMGQGTGQFTKLAALALPAAPRAITLADYDQNGTLDLVVRAEETVVIALGVGDGTFTPPVSYPLGFTVSISSAAVAAADVNGDGRPDVVTVGSNNAASALIANADGTLQPAITSNSQAPYYFGTMAAADFDGDGKLDLMSPSTNGLNLVHGNGNGTFTFVRSIEFFQGMSAFTTDLNGDGHADVVGSVSGATSEVRLYLNNGDGTFQPPQVFATIGETTGFALADFDGDGHRDFAIAELANAGVGYLAILPGTAAASVVAAPYFGDAPGSARRHFVPVAADFNGDGRPDLVATTANTATWAGELMAADGSVSEAATISDNGRAYAAVDLDRDGKADLLFGANGGAQYARGNGNGTFQAPVSSAFGGDKLIAVDFNHDGILDLAGTTFTPSSVHVGLGKGDGTFLADQSFAVAGHTQFVLAADLNNDGNPDLVTVNRDVQNGQTIGNVSVLVGNGDGTFQAAQTLAITGVPTTAAAADFNGDGKIDLVVGNIGTATPEINLLKGHGDATFDPETLVSSGPFDAIYLHPVDIDGDGVMDLVDLGRGVTVLAGIGDGTFRPALIYPAGAPAGDGVIADFDLDGRLDLMEAADDLTVNGPVGYAIVRNAGCR